VDGTGSRSCPMAGFGVISSSSVTRRFSHLGSGVTVSLSCAL
jgi:hypothetical protein